MKQPLKKMKIQDINAESLRKVSLRELMSLHLRLHQLWGANFEGKTDEQQGNH